MQIQLDHAKCVASGQCVQAAPHVFDQDDDGIVTLVPGNHDAESTAVKLAVRVCPTRVISVAE
ncbi:MAG TPA: ferredoxin [Galbitalea sp.]|jgi:ferredoxin|nr:ferredoxin [Galbitalea sp.]